jgi:hypothetical protein
MILDFVTDKRASNSIAIWGLLFNSIDAINQHGGRLSCRTRRISKLRD